MTSYSVQAFDSSAGNNGKWVYIGNIDPEFSLHVAGLESDGKLDVYLVNNDKQTTPQTPTDSTAAKFATINGQTGGAPSITPVTMSAGWLQIVKTPGAVPTETIVRIAGRQF